MSYLLCLSASDQVAIQDLIYYLEKQPATTDTLQALQTARNLRRFFDQHGETLHIGRPPETGYIRPDPDKIETPNNYEEPIVAEQMYVPPSAEQVIADQAHRINSMDIEYGVGDITKKVSYFLADPSIDMSSLRPTSPSISVGINSDIDPRELQERIAKIADSVVTSRVRTPRSPEQDTGNYKGINHKKAMEIADSPTPYNREALEEALRVLSRHILTK